MTGQDLINYSIETRNINNQSNKPFAWNSLGWRHASRSSWRVSLGPGLGVQILSLQQSHPVTCQLLGVGVDSAPAPAASTHPRVRVVTISGAGAGALLGVVVGLLLGQLGSPQLLLLVKLLGTGGVFFTHGESTHRPGEIFSKLMQRNNFLCLT